jgi:hypothetical protein
MQGGDHYSRLQDDNICTPCIMTSKAVEEDFAMVKISRRLSKSLTCTGSVLRSGGKQVFSGSPRASIDTCAGEVCVLDLALHPAKINFKGDPAFQNPACFMLILLPFVLSLYAHSY